MAVQSRDELNAWLKTQATKLTGLSAKGKRLKLDFVQNAREIGQVLLDARERAAHIPGRFMVWTCQETGIAYSTALLYIDVAKNYDDISRRLADSNRLESMNLRQLREAIRDARHERGEGKPQSGKRKTPKSVENAAVAKSADTIHMGEVRTTANAVQIEEAKVGRLIDPLYEVLVTVETENDQLTIEKALSDWTPKRGVTIGSNVARSVSASVRPDSIGAALQKLGKALDANPPKTMKVSINR